MGAGAVFLNYGMESAVKQKGESMKSRSLLLPLTSGFGILVILIAILGVGAIRRARAIYNEMETRTHIYSRRPLDAI
jgi:hypothetical protein